jgi:hypothetical protein
LNADDQKELEQWVSFAKTENGESWMEGIEQRVGSAPEFPPALVLEETELNSRPKK